MKGRIYFAAAFSLFACAAAMAELSITAPRRRATLIDGVAAYVNARFITVSEVMEEVHRNPYAQRPGVNEEQMRAIYGATLNSLIDRRLILDYAEKTGMKLPEWTVENRVREIIKDNFDGDESRLHAMLSDRKMSFEEWRQRLAEDLTIQGLRYQYVERRISPTPGQVKAEYEENRDQYRTESAVGVSMIILDPPETETNKTVKVRADEIAKALAEGKSFADLARLYSSDSKAAQGGSWGKVNPEEVFRAEICEALGRLKAGEVSPLLELDGFGYIVRKDNQQDSRILTMEEALPYVEGRLRVRMGEEFYKKWTDRLRADAYVKVVALPGMGK